MPTTPMTADAFLSTLGVNTHIGDAGVYSNLTEVIADLQYLGIDQIRDGTIIASNDIPLAQAGVKFDFIAVPLQGTTASLDSQMAITDQIAQAVPGSVIAVEGANEINDFSIPFNWNGQTVANSGIAGAVNLQQTIYSMVHSDPNLVGTAVYYFTGYGAAYADDGNTTGTVPLGPNPYTTAGLADYDSQHIYPISSFPLDNPMTLSANFPNESSPSGPTVYTEVGYSTEFLSPTNIEYYTLDLLMDVAQSGVSKTYLYELVEDGGDGYGLFSTSNVATPAAVGIHNLTTILADNGTGGVAPTALNDTITGLPSTTGNSMVIEKSNGTFDIAVWNEATRAASVTVAFGGTYSSVEVFDPTVGTSPVQTYSHVSSVSLSLTNHPEIIQLIGLETTSNGGGGTVL